MKQLDLNIQISYYIIVFYGVKDLKILTCFSLGFNLQ